MFFYKMSTLGSLEVDKAILREVIVAEKDCFSFSKNEKLHTQNHFQKQGTLYKFHDKI